MAATHKLFWLTDALPTVRGLRSMKGSAGLAAFICIRKLFFTFLVKVFANTNNAPIFVLPNAMKRAGKTKKNGTVQLSQHIVRLELLY